MVEPPPYHEEVLGLLEDIASLDSRIGPDELVALWFDALYFPTQSYVNAEGQAEWASCFSSSELAALAKFNKLFDGVVDGLVKDSTWRESEGWLRVSTAAKSALKEAASNF
jgi:hypothetical protein